MTRPTMPTSVGTASLFAAAWVSGHFLLSFVSTFQHHPPMVPVVLLSTAFAAAVILGVLGRSRLAWHLMMWPSMIGGAYWTAMLLTDLENEGVRDVWRTIGEMPLIGTVLQIFYIVVVGNLTLLPYVVVFCLALPSARRYCNATLREAIANLNVRRFFREVLK